MISRFFNYVEIKTKITSVFPFFMVIGFILYKGFTIRIWASLVFFCGMFLFDLTTTTINNYIDTKTNNKPLPYERRKALTITYVLFGISALLGLYLVLLTDWMVLILGGLCFLGGVFYTYGPVPISRQPLGELFSGFFYGFMIPLILFYVNMPDNYYFSLGLDEGNLKISLALWPVLELVLLSVAPVMCTANIMLANNICDLERDVAVGRHTLPYYIGGHALHLFKWLYYTIYVVWIIMVMLKILHPVCLLGLLSIFPVRKNIYEFFELQIKETTFLTSIKNYVIIMSAMNISIWLSILFR